jgi:hypothetical protein
MSIKIIQYRKVPFLLWEEESIDIPITRLGHQRRGQPREGKRPVCRSFRKRFFLLNQPNPLWRPAAVHNYSRSMVQ